MHIDSIVVRRQTQPRRCPKCMLEVAPDDGECKTCGWDFNAPEGTQLQSSSDVESGGNGALLLGYLFLLLVWLFVGGAASLAPRLSPGVSGALADLAFQVWIALPITLAAVVFWPSGVTAVGVLGHSIAWLWVVSNLWQSLP